MTEITLDSPLFVSLNRFATRPFRNAEVVTVPDTVKSVSRFCEHFKCQPHQVMYEVDTENGREWVDSSRDVCAVFDGEVVIASRFCVSLAFDLPVVAERPPSGSKREFDNPNKPPCNNFPAVLLDPVKWRRIKKQKKQHQTTTRTTSKSSGKRRQRRDDDDGAASTSSSSSPTSSSSSSDSDGDDASDDDDDRYLDIRVFVSPHPINVGRRSLRPGQQCIVLKEPEYALNDNGGDDDDDKNNAAADDGDNKSKKSVKTKKARHPSRPSKKQQLANRLKEVQQRRAIGIETFLDAYKTQLVSRAPLGGVPTLFVGDIIWNRIFQHVYATTVFAAAPVGGGGDSDNGDDFDPFALPRQQHQPPRHQSQQHQQQQQLRSVPQRRLLALCCFGAPDEQVIRLVLQRLAELHRAEPLQVKEMSIVLFVEMPLLHFDPAALVHEERLQQRTALGTVPQSTIKKESLINSNNNSKNTNMATNNNDRAKFLLTRLHDMLSNLLAEFRGIVTELDVVIQSASRYVASPARLPNKELFSVYVKEMRGGVNVLESASKVVCLNHRDAMANSLVEMFARRVDIPCVKMLDFLDSSLLKEGLMSLSSSALPARDAFEGFVQDDDDARKGQDEGNDDDDGDDEGDVAALLNADFERQLAAEVDEF